MSPVKCWTSPRCRSDNVMDGQHSTGYCMVLGVVLMLINIALLVALACVISPQRTPSGGSVDYPYNHNVSQLISTTVSGVNEETKRAEKHHQSAARIYKTSGNLGKAAAHVVLNPTAVPRPHEDYGQILSWRHDIDAALLNGEITYQDGSLTVKKGGYYYIYSQVVYSGNGTQELDYGRIIHAVIKQKRSEVEELMRNLQSTPSIRRGRPAYTTSSLGATFYLEANSKVKVKSSVPENIDVNTPHSTYFGMFLI